LGFAREAAGLAIRIVDAGHAGAASRAAAGIINPVAGRRFVQTPQIDLLLPLARSSYARLEQILGVPLWREMRVRRWFRDEGEIHRLAAKLAAGELAPYVTAADAAGCWIEPAARVDVPALLAAARARWLDAGVLRETTVDWARLDPAHGLVIDCTGAAARRGPFADMEFAWSKGETLQVAVPGLDPDVILNRGHWLLPLANGTAWVGATHEPGLDEANPTAAARAQLLDAAAGLANTPVSLRAHFAGVRLTMRDKLPVAGRHPGDPRRGICAALGGRGALFAPWLAWQWVEHLRYGREFDPEIAVARPTVRVAG
ncbi:MAG: hypothetical protein RLZZ129_1572, partial [Verrucomicrobiota bacterium]